MEHCEDSLSLWSRRQRVVTSLIKADADVHSPRVVERAGYCGTWVVQWILDAGADVRQHKALSPVFWTAMRGYTKAVKLLLDAGADVNACGKSGSPHFIASTFNTINVMMLLVKGGGKKVRPSVFIKRMALLKGPR